MKIANRFYVASQSMNPKSPNFREWAKPTLEEAIAHATELAQETEKDQIVVQIIKIVKPQRVPVIVEDVE